MHDDALESLMGGVQVLSHFVQKNALVGVYDGILDCEAKAAIGFFSGIFQCF